MSAKWVRWTAFLCMGIMLLVTFSGQAGLDQAKPGPMPAPGASGRPGPPIDPHARLTDPSGISTDPALPTTPSPAAVAARERFRDAINLDQFRLLCVQHQDVVKTLDSWARQSLSAIRNRQSINGQDSLYTALDIAFRPEAWVDRNIIYVQAIPIRQQLQPLAQGDDAKRILQEGLVSYNFLNRPDVQEKLSEISLVASQSQSVTKILIAKGTFENLFATLNIVPPSRSEDAAVTPWHQPLFELTANLPNAKEQFQAMKIKEQPPIPGYSAEDATRLILAVRQLGMGWSEGDPQQANRGITTLVDTLPTLNPDIYPTPTKRTVEIWYNRTFNGTIVAFIYFLAMVLFLMVAVGVTQRVEKYALTAFSIALACHVIAMGVRWWLAGRIPIQNQFESVLGSALIGCVVGYLLEIRLMGRFVAYILVPAATSFIFYLAPASIHWWIASPVSVERAWIYAIGATCVGLPLGLWLQSRVRLAYLIDSSVAKLGQGIFGTAFSFVGFIAMTACLVAPYVFGRDLGAAIGRVAGILETFWLYIHVNIVISSYALITASAVIGAIYLLMKQWYWVNPIEPGFEEGSGGAGGSGGGGGGGGGRGGNPALAGATTLNSLSIESARAKTLDTLDQANMVVLQMAFWLLGIGIICGAVWADKSWGRPWGWDPKETFALVTWIVYLIIVHLRFVTPAKAGVTAFLSLVGFGVMMFNWIFINFFLVGLHSYA